MTVEPLLPVPEIARLLGLSEPTVRGALRCGEIDGLRIQRRWYSTASRLEAWQQRIEHRAATPTPSPARQRVPKHRPAVPANGHVLAFKVAGYR